MYLQGDTQKGIEATEVCPPLPSAHEASSIHRMILSIDSHDECILDGSEITTSTDSGQFPFPRFHLESPPSPPKYVVMAPS